MSGKFSISSAYFKQVLSQLATTIKKNKENELYEQLVFRTSGQANTNEIVLIGSSNQSELQLPIQFKLDVQIEQDFSVNFTNLKKAVDAINGDVDIKFELEKNDKTGDIVKLLMKVGRSKLTFPILSVDGYPFFKNDVSFNKNMVYPTQSNDWCEKFKTYYAALSGIEVEVDNVIVVDIQELNDMFSQTMNSMAVQDIRYYLNGMCFLAKEDNELHIYSTDGHRMAHRWVDCQNIKIGNGGLNSGSYEYLIPRDVVLELQKLSKFAKTGKLMIVGYKGIIKFIFENGMMLSSRLITGKYPNVDRVLRNKKSFFNFKEKTIAVKINKTDFINELNIAFAALTDDNKFAKFGLEFSDSNTLLLTLWKDGAIGKVYDSSIDVQIESDASQDYQNTLLFNGYSKNFSLVLLRDVMELIKTDNILLLIDSEWGSNTNSKPLCIFEDSDESKFEYVLMPLTV